MKKTAKKLLVKYPFFHFQTAKEFETFLQTKYRNENKLDYVDIGGILYTMQEYDMDGKYITYGNKRTTLGFQVETSNRYGNGYIDAQVETPYLGGQWRDDISYAD